MKSRTLLADVEVASAEDLGERLEAASDIEDVRLRPVLLQAGQKKIEQEDLPEPVIPRIRVWATSPLCRFRKYGVALSVSRTARYSVPRCGLVCSPAWIVNRKRQVRVVAVQQVQLAEIVHVVAGNGRKERIELVVGLWEQRAIGVR